MLTVGVLVPFLLVQAPLTAPRPDIVVFVIDDVADSDIDAIPTPNIHALAASGVRFRRAYSHAKCAPTRDSFNYSRFLGLDRGDACASPVAETHWPGDFSFAEMLDGQGYTTLHVGKWHVGTNHLGGYRLTAHLAGYDSTRFEVPIGPTCNVPGPLFQRIDDGRSTEVKGDNSILCRDAFLGWWQATPSPRFAVVNFGAAHEPFARPDESILPPGTPDPDDATNRQEFEWEVMGVDFVIGQMLAVIPSSAYVVFLGDNGTPGIVPGESEAKTVATRADQDPNRAKLTCYEDGVRIPLIVKGPGVATGSTSQALVHVADLMPTFAGLLGIQPAITDAQTIQGRDFSAALSGKPGPQDPVFVWNPPPRLDRAMIGPRWKLLTRPDGVEELFDLQDDPLEKKPLPPTGPEADKLRSARDALVAQGP